MNKLYNNLIEHIKPTIQNIEGTDVVIVDIECFADILSEFLKNNHCNRTSEEILKDLRG